MSDGYRRSDIANAWNRLDVHGLSNAVLEDVQMQSALKALYDTLVLTQHVAELAKERVKIAKAEKVIADAEARIQEIAHGPSTT